MLGKQDVLIRQNNRLLIVYTLNLLVNTAFAIAAVVMLIVIVTRGLTVMDSADSLMGRGLRTVDYLQGRFTAPASTPMARDTVALTEMTQADELFDSTRRIPVIITIAEDVARIILRDAHKTDAALRMLIPIATVVEQQLQQLDTESVAIDREE